IQDYALWDVIENGNSFMLVTQTTTEKGGAITTTISSLVTAKEKIKKKNDVKARTKLLMALPNEHLMTFNQYKDAKSLFVAIEIRFGVVWKNKPDLDTMSIDDLYNNFKIFEQEVKVTLVHEDLEQIHEDELEEIVGFDRSYMAEDEVPTNMAVMAFSDSEFESYGPKSYEIESKNASEDIPNELKEYPDAPLVKDKVSNNKDCSVESLVVVEKKTVVPTVAKVEVVRPKQQEKPVRKTVKYVVMLTAITIKGKGLYMGIIIQGPKAVNTARPKAVNTARTRLAVVNAVRANQGHPQKNQGYVNSGCSRHMTGNMSYLSDFKEFYE
nr:ribonuclease H-like domain-containing protein [Tanacetum cinerariifolium]